MWLSFCRWWGFFLVFTSLVFTCQVVLGLEYEDEDTVIVEACSEEEQLNGQRFKRQFGVGFPFGPNGFPHLPGFPGGGSLFPSLQPAKPVKPPNAGSCISRSGEDGVCATLRQCYPIVYMGEGDDESVRNPGLAAELRDAAGPCDSRSTMYSIFMFRADAEARQRQICCTSHKPRPNPPGGPDKNPNQTMRPPRPQTQRPQSTLRTTSWIPWTPAGTTMRTTWAPWTQGSTTQWSQGSTTQWTQGSSTVSTEWPGQPTHPPLPTHPPSHTHATHPPFPSYPSHTTRATTTTNRPIYPYPPQTHAPPAQRPPSHPIHTPPTPQTHPTAPPPVSSSCGHIKIVGGTQAQKGEFPWLVALMSNGKQFCGGSLIDSQYVLTAAHCVQHMQGPDVMRMRIYVGDWDLYSNSDGPVTVKSVSKLIRHRGFSHQTLHNDIALLKLDSPVQFGRNGNNNIQPICLNHSPGYDGGNSYATVAGWGGVTENGAQPSIYRKVDLRVWTNNECRSKYGHLAPGGITSHMVCAGSIQQDACRGDSGGPLMKNSGGHWEQIGIVSWGIGCGRYPGVYSRVDHFASWISKNRQY